MNEDYFADEVPLKCGVGNFFLKLHGREDYFILVQINFPVPEMLPETDSPIAFCNLKKKCTSKAPVLALPNYHRPFILFVYEAPKDKL